MSKISDFIDEFVPKNLSKKRRLLLIRELENHLFEKIDFYKEIGYGDEDSKEKAIADFGTDEDMKKSIFNEFEELYSEKRFLAILSLFGILLMNYLCFPLDIWVTSADFNDDPTPLSSLISFGMILAVCGLITFARVKKYRKMLVSIGVANFVIGGVFLLNFYSQCAVYSIAHNLVYLIDVFTPASIGDYIVYGDYNVVSLVVWEAIPFIFAIYCFIVAVKIKRGSAKNIINPKKKIIIFSVVFSMVAILTSALLPKGLAYNNDYKVWFNEYNNFISDESETMFDNISVGDSYYNVSNMLISQGYTTAKAYEETLDRIELKQFRNSYEKFNFADGYEVWFKIENRPIGNGFVGIKQENGIIIAKGIGNLEETMYDDENNFGYSEIEFNHNMHLMTDYFRSLEKGNSEAEIMNRFDVDLGSVYSKRFSIENEVEKHYYRLYCYGIVNPQEKNWYEKRDNRYIELTFENGTLKSAIMYDKIYLDKKSKIIFEAVE